MLITGLRGVGKTVSSCVSSAAITDKSESTCRRACPQASRPTATTPFDPGHP
jgi:hypothetical protein